MSDWKHPNDMTRDELREIVSDMSWMALDLAQHLNFSNEALKEEYREEAYQRAEKMAYELSHYPYHGPDPEAPASPGVAVFGETGLEGWT